MQGTIVCGIAPTADAEATARLAQALAARLALRLVLVHVVEERHDDPRASGELGALAHTLGPQTELRIVHGNRVDGLARVAADEGADAILLGARCHGAGGRRLRCTLARELEAAQAVPVLIAPPTTRARSGRRLGLVEPAPQR